MRRRTTKGLANFGRYAEANAAIEQSPDVVFMGNSITDNWAHMDPDFFAKNNFVGRGISGQTSSEMLVRFRRDVIDLKPEAVVILSGTNDVAQNNGYISPENTLGNIISMCELAKAHGIKVILCSITPTSKFGWRPEIEPAQKIREPEQDDRGVRQGQQDPLPELLPCPDRREGRPATQMER